MQPSALPALKTLWLWHAAEEAEHKAVAYDVYRALEDSREWRVTLTVPVGR